MDPEPSGLEAEFLANRDRLLRFLMARGAGDGAEDLLQDIWLKIKARPPGPVAAPVSYLFRVANTLMIDRFRSATQARQRDHDWSDLQHGDHAGASDAPSAERRVIGRQAAQLAEQALQALGERQARVFRRHRIDGIAQRQVAEEFGVSLSTVESDLRAAYRALAELKERLDEV